MTQQQLHLIDDLKRTIKEVNQIIQQLNETANGKISVSIKQDEITTSEMMKMAQMRMGSVVIPCIRPISCSVTERLSE